MSGDCGSIAVRTAHILPSKPTSYVVVTDSMRGLARDLDEIGFCAAGYLASQDYQAGLDQRFQGDAGIGVLCDQRIEDGVEI